MEGILKCHHPSSIPFFSLFKWWVAPSGQQMHARGLTPAFSMEGGTMAVRENLNHVIPLLPLSP